MFLNHIAIAELNKQKQKKAVDVSCNSHGGSVN